MLQPRVPNTQTATAFAVKVLMKDNAGTWRHIGVISKLSLSDTRSGTPVGGMGLGDHIAEIVPGRTGHQLSAEYFTLYRRTLFQALGLADTVRMLSEIMRAVDIQQQMRRPDTGEVISTWYRGCVVTNWGKEQAWGDSTIITETATIQYASADDGKTINVPAEF